MKAEIERVENGFIVTWDDFTEDDGSLIKRSMVFTDKEGNFESPEKGELEALQEALYEVKEQLGYHYSKHNKHNLIIEIEEKSEEPKD